MGSKDLSREAFTDSGGPLSGEGAGPLSMLTCQMLAAVAAEAERSARGSDSANDPAIVALMIDAIEMKLRDRCFGRESGGFPHCTHAGGCP